MVFGDVFFTGGKALKSDILAKKVNFFRTLGDHIQDIGLRVTANEILFGVGQTISLYKVPERKTAYLFFAELAAGNNTITAGVVCVIEFVIAAADPHLLSLILDGNQSGNKAVAFPVPLKLFEGEELQLRKNIASASVDVTGTLILFEIDKEVSIQ